MVKALVLLSVLLAGCANPFPRGGRAGMAIESSSGAYSRPRSDSPRAPARYPVDAVIFGVREGASWRIVPYVGADRSAALAWFRSGQPMPHGLIVVARTAEGGYVFVTPDRVRWE